MSGKIEKLWGQLSNVGAHATKLRLKFASYELEGKPYDRMGGAFDPESAELALALVPAMCLQFLDAFEHAYHQDDMQFPEAERLSRLANEYNVLPEVKVPEPETTA